MWDPRGNVHDDNLWQDFSVGAAPGASPTARSESRWDELFGQLVATRRLFKPVYLSAVAPVIAGLIDSASDRTVKILTVGGGDGHFSREVLPEVKSILKKKHSRKGVEVLETDISDKIKNAPGRWKQVNIMRLTESMGISRFNLVIGESMLHQAGRNRVGQAIHQISGVLKEGGVFVHIQDNAPDPRGWTDNNPFEGADPLVQLNSNNIGSSRETIAQAHAELIKELSDAAKAESLRFGALTLRSSGTFDKPKTPMQFNGHDLSEYNSLEFAMGVFAARRSDEIPEEMVQLQYTGILSLTSRDTPITDILNNLQRRGYNGAIGRERT